MGARGRGGSDTSWRVGRCTVTRARALLSFSVIRPSDRSDRSIRSNWIDRIGSDYARAVPSPHHPCLLAAWGLSSTRARAAAAAADDDDDDDGDERSIGRSIDDRPIRN